MSDLRNAYVHVMFVATAVIVLSVPACSDDSPSEPTLPEGSRQIRYEATGSAEKVVGIQWLDRFAEAHRELVTIPVTRNTIRKNGERTMFILEYIAIDDRPFAQIEAKIYVDGVLWLSEEKSGTSFSITLKGTIGEPGT